MDLGTSEITIVGDGSLPFVRQQQISIEIIQDMGAVSVYLERRGSKYNFWFQKMSSVIAVVVAVFAVSAVAYKKI